MLIVTVDDASLSQYGGWPWRRSIHAELVDRLTRAEARAIGFSFMFFEPSTDLEDQALAEAMRRSRRVVLPVSTKGQLDPSSGAQLPIRSLAESAAGLGHTGIELDRDGAVRSLYLEEQVGGVLWTGLVVEMLVTGGDLSILAMLPGKQIPAQSEMSTDTGNVRQRGRLMRIEFGGPPGHVKTVSYADVLAGRVPSSVIKGRYVLVGTTATGLGDTYLTPASGRSVQMSGVEVLANALNTLRSHAWVEKVLPWQNALFNVVPAVLVLLAFRGLRPWMALTLLPVSVILVMVAAFAARQWLRVEFEPAAALIGIGAVYPAWAWLRLAGVVSFLDEQSRRDSNGVVSLPGVSLAKETASDVVGIAMANMATSSDQSRRAQRFVRACLDGLADSVCVVSGEGRILLANRAARSEFNIIDDGRGYSWDALVQSELGGAPQLEMQALRREGLRSGFEVELTTTSGRNKLAKCVPMCEMFDFSNIWTISLVDVSEVRAAQRDREETMRFISHDLRAPLASILALLEIWRGSGVARVEDATRLDRIEASARRTMSLANEFTQLARLEEQAQRLVPIDLVDVLMQAIDEFWEQIAARQLQLELDCPKHECWSVGDRAVLLRALGNLLSNAIKFSSKGGIITCALSPKSADPDSPAFWELSVADRGPGIEPKVKAKLFTRFHHATAGDGVMREGFGLGLAYVKAAARMMSGWADVSSEPGCGARFFLRLPVLLEFPDDERPVRMQ